MAGSISAVGRHSLSIDLGLPIVPDIVQDPAMAAELQRIINAINAVASAVDSYTGRAPLSTDVAAQLSVGSTVRSSYLDIVYGTAAEDLPAGVAAHVLYDATTEGYTVSKADAATNKLCHGFVVIDGGVKAGSLVSVNIGGGLIPYIAGLTPGIAYYAAANGAISNVPTSTMVQPVGWALAPTILYFIPQMPI